jgi:hypothetical protein
MDSGLHRITQRRVDSALARHERLTAKGVANDEDTEVSATSRGAGVSGMERAFIRYLQVFRLKRFAECFL